MEPWNVVAQYRKRIKMTQQEAVDALKPTISLRQLQGYEAGERKVSHHHAEKLGELLGIPAELLLNNAGLGGRLKHLLAEQHHRSLTEDEKNEFPTEMQPLMRRFWSMLREQQHEVRRLDEADKAAKAALKGLDARAIVSTTKELTAAATRISEVATMISPLAAEIDHQMRVNYGPY